MRQNYDQDKIARALQIIIMRAPQCAREVSKFQDAVSKKSGILYKRFRVLVDNAMSGEEREDFTQEEKSLLGEVLLALSPERKTDVLPTIRVTPAEREKVEEDAANAGLSVSAYVRERLL